MSTTSPIFEWSPDYDNILYGIASTDVVETEWPKLRDIIKHKLNQNIDVFLAQPKPPTPTPSPPLTTSNGGLKLPPFGPRQQQNTIGMDVPVSYMNREQAEEMIGFIFSELDQFESNAPFTIQRLCELCTQPKQHYNSVGKYLRAVEKSLLVTSSKEDFSPSVTSQTETGPLGLHSMRIPPISSSTPSTPLFSPIPFLHEDARRSKSRSPPPSPLVLSSTGPINNIVIDPLEPKALGLVDELDDPSPGHMSDHPTALTAVTTLNEENGRPFIDTLETRFVKAEGGGDAMVVDNPKEEAKQ